MIRKTYTFKIDKAQRKENRATFEGYASTFGNKDYDEDIIQYGAFKRTLEERGQKFPILVDHWMAVSNQAGWNLEAKEDDVGLFVKGELNLETDAGKTAHALMKQAADHEINMGLSIGFTIKDYEIKDEIRIIKDLDLYEYSIVVYGANPLAGVTSVKDLKDPKDIAIKKREIEQALRDAGCSKREAQKGVSAIFDIQLKQFYNLLNI